MATTDLEGMKTNRRRIAKGALTALAFLGLLAASGSAKAESLIKQPGEHPHYAVEVEPHLDFSLFGYGGLGVGVGGRVSIPIVQDGFISSINNSVAIGFGLDFNHYSCGGGGYIGVGVNVHYDCSENFLFVPVVLQWNFYVAPKWSVFGEPGIALFHEFYSSGCAGNLCVDDSYTSVTGVFEVGARYHFTDHVALTLRAGFPTFSAGVSFM